MKLRRFRPLNSLTMFGLLALALANVTSVLVRRHTAFPERLTDPAVGFLYGVAIGAMLVGIWRQGRGMRGQSRCA